MTGLIGGPNLTQGANVQCCLDSQIAQDMAAPETYCRNKHHWHSTTTDDDDGDN